MDANRLSVPQLGRMGHATPEPVEAGIKRSRSTVMLENSILERSDNFEVGDWETCQEIYKRHKERCVSMTAQERETYMKLLRFHSGWWGSDEKSSFNGPSGKTMNIEKLKQTLVLKKMEWFEIRDVMMEQSEKISHSGIFVFQHKNIQCFRYVGQGKNILDACQKIIYGALGATMEFEPFLPILLSTLAGEWAFYFEPLTDQGAIDVAYNEAIFKHHTLWPFGGNINLQLTPMTLPEIRRSAKKWHWPPIANRTIDSMESSLSGNGIGEDRITGLSGLTYSEYRQFIVESDDKHLERYGKDVRRMYEMVNEIKTRHDSFTDEDWSNLQHIVDFYAQIFKREDKDNVRALKIDTRLQSGWWGLDIMRGIHEFNGRIMNLPCLTDVLVRKCLLWSPEIDEPELYKNIGHPGIFCFQHKTMPHLRYVDKSENVLDSVRQCINDSLTACSHFPQLAALLLSTKAEDWYFYFTTTEETKYLDIDFNDMILKHDSLWPHGLNRRLEMNPLTLGDMQLSCVKYKWPPERNGNKVLPLPPAILQLSDFSKGFGSPSKQQ
ncbi:uncharacterized protein LOC141900450 [Tubulanus polymorphus]|uniref:uncharacterized protein LOC141900450 n=1 Tax=Tubulanus polymorphus TaxID=672921 RepID=UPI003DA42E0F